MQLITGGKGFIGMNTARALLDRGESCVLVTRDEKRSLPEFLQKEIGKRIFVQALDLGDKNAVLETGQRYKITGIIHLAGAVIGRGTFQNTWDETQSTVQGTLNILQAANNWGVSRVSVASTIGVYAGVGSDPCREDMPVTMSPTHPLPMSKKILELIGGILSFGTGLRVVNLRIGGAWGPLFHHALSPWNIPGHLVKSAVNNQTFAIPPVYAEEGVDSCYVKDLGRAIALLQLASSLRHETYNVGTGRAMRNRDVVAAIKKAIPEADIQLSPGYDPKGFGKTFSMDTSRLQEDTGFEPEYDVERGVADYIAWLRQGNEN